MIRVSTLLTVAILLLPTLGACKASPEVARIQDPVCGIMLPRYFAENHDTWKEGDPFFCGVSCEGKYFRNPERYRNGFCGCAAAGVDCSCAHCGKNPSAARCRCKR